MRSFKRILAAAAVIALIAGTNCLMEYLLCPYTTARVEVHRLESGGYEQLVVGTSHGKSGIDPEILTSGTGMETLNICRGGEYPEDVLALVKEAAAANDLKRVVYEVDPAYWEVTPNQIADYTAFYRELPLSVNKLEYFWSKMLNADYRTGLTTWYLYRNNLKRIPETVRMKRSDTYRNYEPAADFETPGQSYTERGFLAVHHQETDRVQKDIPTLWSGEGTRIQALQAAERLVSFCRQENIELVLVMLPVPEETYTEYRDSYDAAAVWMDDFAETQQVQLISFWAENRDPDFASLELYVDYDGHMYEETAGRFTEKLVQKLQQ